MLKEIFFPTYIIPTTDSLGHKIRGTAKIYLVYLFAAISLFFLLLLLDELLINNFFNYSMIEQFIVINQKVKVKYGNYAFIFVVLLGPLIEEIFFRLPLRLEKVGIGLSVALITYRLSVDQLLIFEFNNIYSYGKVALALVAFLLTLRFLPDSWLAMIKKKYFYFFYFMASAFALFHVTNFAPYNQSVLLFYPIFTLPQFLMGLFIGHARMKYGFFYGVALHSLINLPSVLFRL